MIMVMDPTYSGYWVKFLVHCVNLPWAQKLQKSFQKRKKLTKLHVQNKWYTRV
jgi:hypothetical protein